MKELWLTLGKTGRTVVGIVLVIVAVGGVFLLLQSQGQTDVIDSLTKTSIGDVRGEPEKYAERGSDFELTVQDAVCNRGLGVSYLLLVDESGQIWYREGGERAHTVMRDDELEISAHAHPNLSVPGLVVPVLGLVKYDMLSDLVASPGRNIS